MDRELLEQLQLIVQGMDSMEQRLGQRIESLEQQLAQKIEDSETRTKVIIENEIGRKIEALFDGYKLTHEKQWELERETQRLKEQISDLQSRIAAIEDRLPA